MVGVWLVRSVFEFFFLFLFFFFAMYVFVSPALVAYWQSLEANDFKMFEYEAALIFAGLFFVLYSSTLRLK